AFVERQSAAFEMSAYCAFHPDIVMEFKFPRLHCGRQKGRYATTEAIEIDRAILELSGLFDPTAYRIAAGLKPMDDPARHSLLNGWRSEIEPAPSCELHYLKPYFAAAGRHGPTLVEYALLRAAGRPVYATYAQARQVADSITSSGPFNEESYRNR